MENYIAEAVKLMSPNDVFRDNLRFASASDLQLLHGVMGITGEAGEIQELIKKYYVYGAELNMEKLREEIGDLLWYIAISLDAMETNFEEIMVANIAKLKARYSTGVWTQTEAINRNENSITKDFNRYDSPSTAERKLENE